MKYLEIINKIKESNETVVTKEQLFELYKELYNNDNMKTFNNMISLLKSYNILTDFSKNDYIILNKQSFEINVDDEIKNISQIIAKEYTNIKFTVWNTKVLNEFTQHYVINNYIIVETEKIAINLILMLLKEHLYNKYTIVTESMFNENKELFLNNENILVVKSLIQKSPLEKSDNVVLEPTIEKILVDIYKDKLYEQYQGKELERIYKNVFNNYNINFRKLSSYANYRGIYEEYKKFLRKLNIVEKV